MRSTAADQLIDRGLGRQNADRPSHRDGVARGGTSYDLDGEAIAGA
jgi:hypothetical protein